MNLTTLRQELLATEYFGNTTWDYVVAVAVFLAVFTTLPILKAIITKNLQLLSKKTETGFDDLLVNLLRKFVGPFVYLWAAIYFGTLWLTLPENLAQLLHTLFVILVTFKSVQLLQGFVVYGVQQWTKWRLEEDPTSAAMIKNMTIVIRLVIWAAAVLFILDNLGINITAAVAGLGVGGVAVALAAQAVLGDAFSSFAIFMDKPFQVGDFIIVGDLLGTVEHVGFKTTRIRSLGGEQLVFSNSDLTSSRIKNYKRMRERRVVFSVGVIYQTSVEQVKAIPKTIESVIKEHKATRFDRAHFQSFGDFALIFEVVYYVLSPDYNTYMDTQQFINVRIMEEFAKAKIEFAYPTQLVYHTKVSEPA